MHTRLCDWGVAGFLLQEGNRAREVRRVLGEVAGGRMGLKVAFVANDFSACRVKMWRLVERLYGKGCVDLYMLNTIQKQSGLRDDRCHKWSVKAVDQLAKKIRKHDVIHVFCDNTAVTESLIRRMPDRKLVVHRHDLSSLRGLPDPTEVWVTKHSRTRVIATSPIHLEWLAKQAKWKQVTLIPNAPLFSECLDSPPEKRKPGLVYYGGLVKSPTSSGVGYRHYFPQWQVLGEAGIEVHVYPKPTRLAKELRQYYQKIPNCHVHGTIVEEKIIQVVSQYEVSFIGYNDVGVAAVKHRYAMTCWPNKTFDPIAAGTPLLGYRTGVTESLWKDQWGVATQSIDGLVEGYHKARQLRPDWKVLRKKYTLDQYIPALKRLYSEVMSTKNN